MDKVKHHRAHGAGRRCHPLCKSLKRAIDSEDDLQQSRKRPARASSDPGEIAVQQPSTRRVTAPRSLSRMNTREEERIKHMLDATHERRMAMQASAAAASAAVFADS